MTRLQHSALQLIYRSAAAGRPVAPGDLAIRLGAPPRRIATCLAALERAGLVNGTRLTLSGLAVAVATRPARRRPRPIALAA